MTDETTLEAEILAAFDEWDAAINTGDPDVVTALYAPHAILVPTMSNQVRHTPAEIRDYFVLFLQDGTRIKTDVVLDEANVQVYDDVAINSGLYTFAFRDDPSIQARFTFAYERINGRWLIVAHHSSAMPEG